MCGIFGYAGADANPGVLIEGIKSLEYRGLRLLGGLRRL